MPPVGDNWVMFSLRLSTTIRHILSLCVTFLFLLPFLWMITISLRPVGLPPPTRLEWWPAAPQWANYLEIFQIVPMARYTLNSLIVVGVAVPLTLFTASLAGFSITQLPGRARRVFIYLSIGLMLIPASALWMFRFQILRRLGLIDSLWALILPAFAASNPLFVLLMYWAFQRVPAELYEAARLEGATFWGVWWRIALPLARSTMMAVTVLTFVLYWSDFSSPVLYIYTPKLYTLPVGLQILKQVDLTNWPLLMAAAAFMTLPVLLFFVFVQHHFFGNNSLAQLFDRN